MKKKKKIDVEFIVEKITEWMSMKEVKIVIPKIPMRKENVFF